MQGSKSAAANEFALSIDALRRTLIYHVTDSPARIHLDLSNLKELDKDAEAKQRLWTILAVGGLIMAGISLLAIFATQNSTLIVGIVLGACGAIAGFVMRARHGRLNLDDRRYTMVSELLRYLATDMSPDGLVDLTINFNSYRKRHYQTGRAGGAASYALPWMALKGAFADGNRFRLGMTQVVKRKERRKRKYTKVKESFREKISLTILPKVSRYTRLERIETLMRGATLPSGVQLRWVRCNANRIDMQALTACHQRVRGRSGTDGKNADQLTSNYHTILGLFLACYYCLGQCRSRKGA